MPSPKLLLVEDDLALAELLEYRFENEGYDVRVTADGDEALVYAAEDAPDLVILDWMLPGQSGLQLARRWRGQARTRALPVIMLTARVLDADKVTGLDAGADDYLTKPFSPTELMARIRAVLRRKSPEALDSPVEVGPLRLDPATHRVSGHGQEVKMGATEFKLLHFFLSHPERVHSRTQLLDKVWGDHVFIEERTIDVHVKRLREALTPVRCAHLIETVRGAGYRLTLSAKAVSE